MKKHNNKAADTEGDGIGTAIDSHVYSIRDWLIRATQTFTKFAFILIFLGVTLLLANTLSLPIYITYLIALIISTVLFIMLVMISIENIVYQYLKNSIWGQILLYLLVALISVISYLWAISDINRIFQVDPSNLALTTTLLTAIHFFKYAIIILLSSYFVAIGLYFFYRFSDKSDSDDTASDTKALSKKVIPGVLFALIIATCLLAVGKISEYSDVMIKDFAINIDFYSHYTCIGEEFQDIEGVLFLSASDILVAKKVGSMEWEFKKVKCEP